MSNTSIFLNIVYRSRLHVSTLIGSSSGLLFEINLQNTVFVSNRRSDDDPIRVETCSLLLSTI